MNGFQSSLYTVAIALCVFSTGLIRHEKSRTGKPVTWFTTFLIVETLGFVFELLMVHPATPLKSLWLGLRMATSLLVAPSLWLAVKECVDGVRPSLAELRRKDWGVIGAGIALLLPLIASAHLGPDYARVDRVISAWHAGAIHGTMLLCMLLFALQVPYYLWRCRHLLVTQFKLEERANSDGAARSLAWLQLPLVVVCTTWLLGVLRTLQCAAHLPQGLSLVFAVTDVGVTVGAMYVIVRRASSPEPCSPALEPEPPDARTPVAVPELPVPVTTDRPVPTESKYARSSLPAPTRARIKRRLDAAMAKEKLYQDSLLNLRSLSRAVKENAHYVSQVINQDLNTTFYEFVNRHRIEQAKKLLEQSPDQTVLEIALAVGFNSKSTFNAAFRRIAGTTPRQFRSDRTR